MERVETLGVGWRMMASGCLRGFGLGGMAVCGGDVSVMIGRRVVDGV